VDLLKVMRDEGFLIDKRIFTSPLKAGQREAFGQAGPVEMPNKQVCVCFSVPSILPFTLSSTLCPLPSGCSMCTYKYTSMQDAIHVPFGFASAVALPVL